MAAVLEALASYVTNMVMDMAEEEVHMLLGIRDEIEKLGQNLNNIKAFLADAERRRITDELVQGWVRMLKGVMYDATDVLELGQLKAQERRVSIGGTLEEKMPNYFQPFLFCLRNPVFAHRMGSRIKDLNQRLDDIRNQTAKFNFTANLCSYPEQRRTEAEYCNRRMTTEFIPSTIVGEKIERDPKLLVQELVTDKHHCMKLVSVVGMGGIGKTTLAQKVFKDTTIHEHFKTKIWLSITQQFNEVELLRTAIKQAGGDHNGEENNTLLMQALIKTLSAKKFLLVLDDIWSVKAWENIFSVPVTNVSDKQQGSRVLITTRIENLAPQMHESFYQHHVSSLDEEDAWSLLKIHLGQLPNKLPSLEVLQIEDAPAVERVGPEFQACSPLVVGGGITSRSAAFPNLTDLYLKGLFEWEEWEWEEPDENITSAHVIAMPALKVLTMVFCINLRFLPPGLASSRRYALRKLDLQGLHSLEYVENFPSVVELGVFDCPELEWISGPPMLHKITIACCPNLELLEGVPTLDSLVLTDSTMETLPGYLQAVNPRHLEVNCSRKLSESISSYSSEWNKIRHIRTLVTYYFDPDLDDWSQVPVKSHPSAEGLVRQLETGSKQSKASPSEPTEQPTME